MPGPRLRSTYRALDRGPDALQLGLGEGALVLSDVPHRLLDAVRRLDGATTRDELHAHVARGGLPRAALDDLLDALTAAGAVDPDTPRRHVQVPLDRVDTLAAHGLDGHTAVTRLARLSRTTVAVAGTGDLVPHLRTALDAVGVRTVTGTRGHADVVVLAARDAIDPVAADSVVVAGRPVLPVVATARGVVVGPWHGRADEPCATCLDLRRRDADDAWPHLLAQLLRPGPDGLPRPADADPAAAGLAAAVVAQWVRRRVVGLPETPGLTCEVDPWQLGTTHRVWPVHPRCPGHDTGQDTGQDTAQDTRHDAGPGLLDVPADTRAPRRPQPAGRATMGA